MLFLHTVIAKVYPSPPPTIQLSGIPAMNIDKAVRPFAEARMDHAGRSSNNVFQDFRLLYSCTVVKEFSSNIFAITIFFKGFLNHFGKLLLTLLE